MNNCYIHQTSTLNPLDCALYQYHHNWMNNCYIHQTSTLNPLDCALYQYHHNWMNNWYIRQTSTLNPLDCALYQYHHNWMNNCYIRQTSTLNPLDCQVHFTDFAQSSKPLWSQEVQYSRVVMTCQRQRSTHTEERPCWRRGADQVPSTWMIFHLIMKARRLISNMALSSRCIKVAAYQNWKLDPLAVGYLAVS